MLYAFGVPVDILTLSLMLEQIYIAMRGGHKMSKNSLRAGIVCACGVAEAVSLKAIVRGAHGGSNPPHSVYPGSLLVVLFLFHRSPRFAWILAWHSLHREIRLFSSCVPPSARGLM